MENQFWNLFRETGEPMGYLLYKAEKKQKQAEKEKKKPQKPEAQPPAKM